MDKLYPVANYYPSFAAMTKKWFMQRVYTGSLVEASLKTERPKIELEPGKHKYTVEQLLAGNGIKKKKLSFSSLLP